MCSGNQIDIVLVVELIHNVSSEKISCSSWAYTPSADIIWVAPHEVAHGAIVRNFLFTVKASDFI